MAAEPFCRSSFGNGEWSRQRGSLEIVGLGEVCVADRGEIGAKLRSRPAAWPISAKLAIWFSAAEAEKPNG